MASDHRPLGFQPSALTLLSYRPKYVTPRRVIRIDLLSSLVQGGLRGPISTTQTARLSSPNGGGSRNRTELSCSSGTRWNDHTSSPSINKIGGQGGIRTHRIYVLSVARLPITSQDQKSTLRMTVRTEKS